MNGFEHALSCISSSLYWICLQKPTPLLFNFEIAVKKQKIINVFQRRRLRVAGIFISLWILWLERAIDPSCILTLRPHPKSTLSVERPRQKSAKILISVVGNQILSWVKKSRILNLLSLTCGLLVQLAVALYLYLGEARQTRPKLSSHLFL